MNDKNNLMYNKALEIISALTDSGHSAYIVGGFVRDTILGVEPNDIDICTSADTREILKVLRKHFPDSSAKLVGASFGNVLFECLACYGAFGKYKKSEFEISPFRGAKDGILSDLNHRDFTCNAMAFDPFTSEVIDPFNGAMDAVNKILRFGGNLDDATETILEDPLRMIRAARFISKYDFKITENSLGAIKREVNAIRYVAPERIRQEILKAMADEKPSKFFESLREFGILEIILPGLAATWKHTGGKHHSETVWRHSMIAGDSLSPRKDPILRLAGYLHDIGKVVSAAECVKQMKIEKLRKN